MMEMYKIGCFSCIMNINDCNTLKLLATRYGNALRVHVSGRFQAVSRDLPELFILFRLHRFTESHLHQTSVNREGYKHKTV